MRQEIWKDDDTDDDNLYGRVVWKINGLRCRFDGEVFSFWDHAAKRFTYRVPETEVPEVGKVAAFSSE